MSSTEVELSEEVEAVPSSLQQLLRCQYLHVCTSKASKLSTCSNGAGTVSSVHASVQAVIEAPGLVERCDHRLQLVALLQQ